MALSVRGRKVLGYTCPLMPEELAHALDLHPMRLTLGPELSNGDGSGRPQGCCTWETSLLAQAEAGRFGHLWGLVFSCNTCPSVRNLAQRWQEAVKQPSHEKIHELKLPLPRDGENAWQLLEEEFQRLKLWLERRQGKTLEPDALKHSARLFNRIRAALRGIQSAGRAGRLPASMVLTATVAAQILDRDEVAEMLEAGLEQVRGADGGGGIHRGSRLMLIGGPLDDPALVACLDRHGALLVEDDSCSFSQYCCDEVDLDPVHPWADMVKRHRRRAALSASGHSSPQRLERILQQVHARGIDGVVFLPIKQCEPQAFDNTLLRRELDSLEIPHLELSPAVLNRGVPEGAAVEAFFGQVESSLVTQ